MSIAIQQRGALTISEGTLKKSATGGGNSCQALLRGQANRSGERRVTPKRLEAGRNVKIVMGAHLDIKFIGKETVLGLDGKVDGSLMGQRRGQSLMKSRPL